MPDLKISQLTAGTTIDNTDILVYVDAGTTKKITYANLLAQIKVDIYASIVTGFVTGADSTVTNADSLEQALEKLQGQIDALKANTIGI